MDWILLDRIRSGVTSDANHSHDLWSMALILYRTCRITRALVEYFQSATTEWLANPIAHSRMYRSLTDYCLCHRIYL